MFRSKFSSDVSIIVDLIDEIKRQSGDDCGYTINDKVDESFISSQGVSL